MLLLCHRHYNACNGSSSDSTVSYFIHEKGSEQMKKINATLTYILLLIFAAFFLMPIYVLFSTSFKPLTEVSLERLWFLPTKPSLYGFIKAFQKLSPNLRNSFILVIPATIISAMVGSINWIRTVKN